MSLSNEVSTHNVEQLAERNDSEYGTLVGGEGEEEERPKPEHRTTLGRLLSRGTDSVHLRLSALMQRVESTSTFQRVTTQLTEIHQRAISPSIQIARTNVTFASENLSEPVAQVMLTTEKMRARVSTTAQQLQDGLAKRWRSFTEGKNQEESRTDLDTYISNP